MAIDCLLIQTQQSFREGKINTKGGAKQVFVNFLTQSNEFKNHFDAKEAKQFYYDFRCGILHQAETMGNTLLWSVGSTLKGKNSKDVSYVNRTLFHDYLKKEIAAYAGDLRNIGNQDLRKNFIKKMNYIARVNEE
jgi:hypothetical protein